jgi:hypothetical protein
MGQKKMFNFRNLLLAIAILSLAVGLLGRANPIVEGLGKAVFGALLTLYFILLFFGEERA